MNTREVTRQYRLNQAKRAVKRSPAYQKSVRTFSRDRICQICGNERIVVGQEFVRSELEFIPAQVQVIDYYRETLECRTYRKNDKPYMEKAPIFDPVILHSMASPSTIAWVMHQKFVNAIPLYRQEKEWQMLRCKIKPGYYGQLDFSCCTGLADADSRLSASKNAVGVTFTR